MRYLSVCSGIEAATCAWHPLGWQAAAFSEIEAFPQAVLAHHYPTVPLHGDFTTIEGDEYGAIDLLVGGTPCQDFSVAGLRAGIAGERGRMTSTQAEKAVRAARFDAAEKELSGNGATSDTAPADGDADGSNELPSRASSATLKRAA